QYGAPPIAIGPLYQPKTLQLCADGDSICGDGNSPVAHGLYAVNGMVGQGANFAASRL
ncbi:cutinase family protein, partial [Escherichia coli]|nr:cutinase family protein [Escherichia coli]